MSILIVPLFISPVIVGQTWSLLLQRPFGPTDFLLTKLLGHDVTISWLTESPWVYFSLILADVWQWTPFMFVILLAGPTAICRADGDPRQSLRRSRTRRRRQLASVLVDHTAPSGADDPAFDHLSAAGCGKAVRHHLHHDRRGPGTKTYTNSFYLYTVGFTQFHLSQATAGAWIFLILTLFVITFLVRRLLKAEPK
jgi:multiple sugar transport system permease protein